LAILARDFVWADRLHRFIRVRLERARQSFGHRREAADTERKAA
jgi:hypothetical protein